MEKHNPNETSAAPTTALKFVNGQLCQQHIVSFDDGTSIAEFRPVESETVSETVAETVAEKPASDHQEG